MWSLLESKSEKINEKTARRLPADHMQVEGHQEQGESRTIGPRSIHESGDTLLVKAKRNKQIAKILEVHDKAQKMLVKAEPYIVQYERLKNTRPVQYSSTRCLRV